MDEAGLLNLMVMKTYSMLSVRDIREWVKMSNWKDRVYALYMSNGFADAHSNLKKEFKLHSKYFKRNYLKYMPEDKNKCILDLGCGMGHFLYFCKEYGYKNCIGIDTSKENVDFICKKGGVQAYNSTIEDFLRDKKDCFDVIVLNDVIEHLTKEEIFDVLDAVMGAMKEGGGVFGKNTEYGQSVRFYCRKIYRYYT